MTPSTAPHALAVAASARQRGCFAEFGKGILRRKAKRGKLAAQESAEHTERSVSSPFCIPTVSPYWVSNKP